MSKVFSLWQVGLIANVKLHFYSLLVHIHFVKAFTYSLCVLAQTVTVNIGIRKTLTKRIRTNKLLKWKRRAISRPILTKAGRAWHATIYIVFIIFNLNFV